MIESVNATDADSVTVHLKDGRTQVITVHDIAHDNQTLQLDEYRDGKKIRQETASGK